MQAKLNPTGTAKINFPGFQEILDFTATGSEASVSVAVDGDTDKEYKIVVRNTDTTDDVYINLNNSSSGYGYQGLSNTSGTITAGRGEYSQIGVVRALTFVAASLLTPTGFPKTISFDASSYSSGTTIASFTLWGLTYNSTSNITSIDFSMSSGNFTAGTRIVVYARRSNV